jgi:hypothetical protein
MGIRPFYPVSDLYTLNFVYAKDIGANLAFLVIGSVVFWAAYRRSKDPVSTGEATASDLAAMRR